MSADPVGQDAASTAQAVTQNAQRLGLKWRRIPGTVTAINTPGQVSVRLDGDDATAAPVDAMSLIGTLIVGDRVMTDHVPPQGIYISGRYGSERELLSASLLSPAEVLAPNATFFNIPWSLKEWDNGGFLTAPGATATIFTIPTTGYYDLTIYSKWFTATPAATGACIILVNRTPLSGGTTTVTSNELTAVTGGHDSNYTLADQLPLEKGDSMQIAGYQSTGSVRNMTARLRITFKGLIPGQ